MMIIMAIIMVIVVMMVMASELTVAFRGRRDGALLGSIGKGFRRMGASSHLGTIAPYPTNGKVNRV